MEKLKKTCLHRLCLAVLIVVLAIHEAKAAGEVSVNTDGNITFADLPEGEPYSSPETFDEGSFPLPTTWDFIGNFLSSVSPGEPPYELINTIIGDLSAVEIALLTDNFRAYQKNLLGFAVCFVIGLLFILIFPIVALCFCCCRCCCKNCGGKMHMDQEDNSCCRVMIYSILLLASLVFVFSGAVTALAISGYTGNQAQTLPTRVSDNVRDLVLYLNNTLNEIDFVMTDQLAFTLDQVRDDLNDIGDLVGVPVRESLRTNVGPAIDSVIAMEDNIDGTLSAMEAIDTRQAQMETNREILDTNLTSILASLTAVCNGCLGCCVATTANLRNVQLDADYRDIDLGMGYGTFPQVLVNNSIDELTDVSNRNLSEQALQGAQTFEDIPETLRNTTASDVADIIVTIDELEGTLNEFINATTYTLQSTSGQVEPIEDQANGLLTTYAEDYDKYRAYVMYVFYGFILFIVVLFLLGLLIGIFSYDRKASPTERSSCSNCGGLFLMAGAGFVFIFGAFIMIITALTFIVGGPIDRLMCDPLVSGQLFAQTVDKYDGILPDGYYLGNLIFKDPSVPFQIGGFLDACEQNEAVYTAFLLENLFNITAFTDISSQIPNVDEQFANLTGDFSTVEILTSDTKQTLIDFRDSPADTINWTYFTDELAKDLIYDADGNADSLSFLITALDTDASTSSGSDATSLNDIKTDLQNLQDIIVDVLLLDASAIAMDIDTLTGYTDVIDTNVNDTIANAEAAQDFIDNNVGSDVQTSVVSYSARVLGYPDQFVTYATYQLENTIGGCRPVYNLWNQAINTLCIGILRSFNGLWFTLGWCIVFFMPALIFGVKLAKYFRTMDTTDGYSDNNGFEMQGQQHYGNKVGPTTGYPAEEKKLYQNYVR